MEELAKGFGIEIAKQGFVVAGLVLVITVLWKDNKSLRGQIEADQKDRERRDDARFKEVNELATRATAGLERAVSTSAAQSAGLENTNRLIEKQGDLLEARTAIFATIASTMLLIEAGLRALKEKVEDALRRFER